MTTTRQPTTVRQLDTPAAMALADLTSMLDDLQTVLYACERLMAALTDQAPTLDSRFIQAAYELLKTLIRTVQEGAEGVDGTIASGLT